MELSDSRRRLARLSVSDMLAELAQGGLALTGEAAAVELGTSVPDDIARLAVRLRGLVPEWLRLVRSKGRAVDITLADLGTMPEATHGDSLALWVAALINPLPPLNLAPDVRSAALCAASTQQRLELVFEAMERSCGFLRRSAWT